MGFEADRMYEAGMEREFQKDLSEKSIPEEWIKERWVNTISGLTRCKKHSTIFAQQEEPCWGCYNEAQREI